jgi:RNA polymerase sigma factor (sigma-70 family)
MTFASLYDQHERQVYNLCLRITGSAEDAADATQETFLKVLERLEKLEGREVNLAAYLMTVARNASYDAIDRRRRALPTDELPEFPAPMADGPEGHVLRDAHQEQVRVANLSLPPRQREVLALRELAELSYDEVAQVMGMNRNSVAQLISRARINLHDGLRRTALGSVASASPSCDRALPLLAMRQDGMLDADAGWLADHLAGCGACRVRIEAMEEAGVAYRLWLPLVPALWLREEIAQAAERTSAASGSRRLRLAAAGGVALVVLAILGVAEAQTPTRAAAPLYEPLVVPQALVPAGEPNAPRGERGAKRVAAKVERVVRKRTPAPVPAAAATPAPFVAAEAVQVAARPEPRVRRRPKPAPAPTATPEAPAVVADPPPPPPEEPPPPPEEPPPACTSPNGCPPPKPPRPPVCPSCGIVAPAPPNGPVP